MTEGDNTGTLINGIKVWQQKLLQLQYTMGPHPTSLTNQPANHAFT